MRAKTNFAERPQAYEIKDGDAGQKIICSARTSRR